MSYDNSGALFRNDRKEKPNHPDHKGSATIEGVEYWVSAWIKEGKNGKYFSMAYTLKEQQNNNIPDNRPVHELDDDDIPF
jgi:hypothetical protein